MVPASRISLYASIVLAGILPLAHVGSAAAQQAASPACSGSGECLCDSSFEDCRTPILELIRNEAVGIDVSYWFMSDTRYSTEIIKRWRAGVPVRILVDTEADPIYAGNQRVRTDFVTAGIPVRDKVTSGINHWKAILYAGQRKVHFSAANFANGSYSPIVPYTQYVDEAIYFTDDPPVVNSFFTKFDDHWTNTTDFANVANITGPLTRAYPVYAIDPDLNFVPHQHYENRLRAQARLETQQIDVVMFRITSAKMPDELIRRFQAGVNVRLITEERQYRNPAKFWHAYNVDRMYAAGIPIKVKDNVTEQDVHQKSVVLHSRALADPSDRGPMVIFGSSNWTSSSSTSQREHNYFTKKPWMVDWFIQQFERKWNNLKADGTPIGTTVFVPFTPLPPSTPQYAAPDDGAIGVGSSVTLGWEGGYWAHKYDIYLGTSPTFEAPLVRDYMPSFATSGIRSTKESYAFSGLQPGTTYYWKIVSKTMADRTKTGPTWSFVTGSTPPPPSPSPLPSPWTSQDIGSTGVAGRASYANGTFTTEGAGADVWGTADAFHYVYRTLSGDGEIVARVATVENTAAWTKMGVMVRAALTPSSPHAFMLVSSGKGIAFQRRTTNGGLSTHTSGGMGTAPRWVRLHRFGDVVTAFVSADGETWTMVGRDTVALPAIVYVGLVSHSHDVAELATATFDGVAVTEAAALPAGWQSGDVGAVGTPGSARVSGDTFTLEGAGADVWGTADAFHYAYRTLTGDGEVTARVMTIENTAAWTKMGVMIRGTLSASSAHAFMLVSSGKGLAFQRRTSTGGLSTHTTGGAGTAPRWVRLRRAGNIVTAFASSDGVLWTTVGQDTIDLALTAYVGLVAHSHETTRLATATFENVAVQNATP